MTREETIAIGALPLDCGEALRNALQRVTVYGAARSDGSNVVLVEHALTGSSRAAEWWPGVVGEGGLFDPADWCVVGINALGSSYGSTGPASRERFPRVTVRDIVRAELRALDALGFGRIAVAIGGSLGGMRALQWAVEAPQRVRVCIAVGAHDHHSAMGVALNALQREAIALDPARGVRLARKIAMLTYKSEELLRARHDRRPDRKGRPLFDVEGYLERQADIFEPRMDGASYVALTHAMDSFDVRGRLRAPAPKLVFAGIGSDWLFRPQDVRAAAARCAKAGCDAQYVELRSEHGHDAFLAEPAALKALLAPVVAAALEPARC